MKTALMTDCAITQRPTPNAQRPTPNAQRPTPISSLLSKNQGFMPVLIAIGIVSLLAAMSLVSSMTAGIQNRKMIERLNRVEGFYSSELLAWHAHERVRQGLDVSGTAVVFDHAYAATVEGVGEGAEGIPYNIIETRNFAPTKGLIRRHVPERFIASFANNSRCGRVGFGGSKKNYRVCLANAGDPPSQVALFLSSDASPFGPTAIWGLDQQGNAIDTFGDRGKLSTNFDVASAIVPSIWPIGVNEWAILGPKKVSAGKISRILGFGIDGKYLSNFGNGGEINLHNFGFFRWSQIIPGPNSTLYAIFQDHNKDPVLSHLYRFDRRGNWDTTFGSQGKLEFQFNGYDGYVSGFGIQSDGKIIIEGATFKNALESANVYYVARYLSNGTLDTSFGNQGVTQMPEQGEGNPHIGPNDDIFLMHNSQKTYLLSASGQLYSNYAGGRPTAIPVSNNEQCSVLSTFKINCITKNEFISYTQSTVSLTQLLPTGELDETYGADRSGTSKIAINGIFFGPTNNRGHNGGIYLACKGETIVKVDSSGKIDPQFGENGTVFTRRNSMFMFPTIFAFP